jgi:hypothetical protein
VPLPVVQGWSGRTEKVMKYRFGIPLAVIVLASVLWFVSHTEDGTERVTQDTIEHNAGDAPDTTTEASEIETADLEDGDPVVEEEAAVVADEAAGELMFGRASPADIENDVYQRIADQPGLELTSLTSVECDTLRCSIVFTGVEANPQYTDEYGELLSALAKPPWDDYQPTASSIGTRELAPGAREYVLAFTYVALVDASDDPRVAARQHAACAGAWTRVTQLRGSDEYMRMAREQAAEHFELAAGVLGSEEAQLLADALQFGPLTRECNAAPY